MATISILHVNTRSNKERIRSAATVFLWDDKTRTLLGSWANVNARAVDGFLKTVSVNCFGDDERRQAQTEIESLIGPMRPVFEPEEKATA